ncbi:MAG: antitoxin [Leptospirales bacterium]
MKSSVTKVFVTGRSQAVRIPKKFRFTCEEVYIEQEGETLVLRPKPRTWKDYFDTGRRFSHDFPEQIEDRTPEERPSL